LVTSIALTVAVCQSGVACPPWQLTFEQVRFTELKDAVPDFALYVERKATSPGGTLSASFPERAFARL
jgi:hypothetical protein